MKLIFGAAIVSVACISSPVLAQSDESAPSAGDMADIVVTARRKEESLQKVPVAITAYTQESLTRLAIYSAQDLGKVVPGLSLNTGGGTSAFVTFSIRGRGQNFGSSAGSVETYFADVPLSVPTRIMTLQPQLFDLENLQVLKGPQGTLFGRSTTGGAVLLVPRAPSGSFEGYARAQFGDYSNRQFEGAVNIPLAGDRAALRVAGFVWKRDGYSHATATYTDAISGEVRPVVDNFTGGILPERTFNNRDEIAVRGTLLLKPTDSLTNSTVVTYQRYHIRSSPQAGLLLGVNGFGTANPTFFSYKAEGAGTYSAPLDAQLNHAPLTAFLVANSTTLELSDNVSLKNIFGFVSGKGSLGANQDFDGTASGALNVLDIPLNRQVLNHQFTNEVQVLGKALDGALSYTLGGMIDIARQPGGDDIRTEQGTFVGACGGTPTCNLVSSVFKQINSDSFSLYAAGTYAVNDRLHMSAGFRHLWDVVEQNTGTVIAPVLQAPNAVIPSATPGMPLVRDKAKFQGNAWNIGLNYDFASGTMGYLGYRRGYKRGGFNLLPPEPKFAKFAPETVDDFVLGLKTDFRVGTIPVRFNIEGFYDLYKGNQVAYLALAPTGLATITTNVDKTTYRGFEFDLAAEPSDWLSIRTNFSYTDAKNSRWDDKSVAGSTVDLSTNPVALNTKYRLMLNARFHANLNKNMGELAISSTISYRSSMYFYPFARVEPLAFQYLTSILYGDGSKPVNIADSLSGANVLPGATLVDLRAEWNNVMNTGLGLAFNVTNVANKREKTSLVYAINFGYQAESYGPPRMWTIEINKKF